MTKTLSTLAALFLASSALSSAAHAGGVRLSFGGPLGSFTAHEKLSDGPGGTARYARPHCDKPSYASKPSYSVARRQNDDDDAPARRPVHKVQKAPVEVAEAPVHKMPRKPKVYIEKQETKPEVKTAKLEDKAVISDAAPAITIPQSPVAQPQLSGTQSTPSAAASTPAPTPAQTAAQTVTQTPTPAPVPVATHTASLETAPITAPAIAPDAEPKTTVSATEVATEPAKAEPVKAEAEKPAKNAKGKSDSMATRLCKRFSAAVAGLVDVPCE